MEDFTVKPETAADATTDATPNSTVFGALSLQEVSALNRRQSSLAVSSLFPDGNDLLKLLRDDQENLNGDQPAGINISTSNPKGKDNSEVNLADLQASDQEILTFFPISGFDFKDGKPGETKPADPKSDIPSAGDVKPTPGPQESSDFKPPKPGDPNALPEGQQPGDVKPEPKLGDKPGEDASKKSGSTKTIFESTKLTPKELDFLGDLAKPEALEKVKDDINKFGRDPKEAILDAAKKSDILGLGELHVTPNGLRTLAETLMPDFKKQGFTHLAVEIHHEHQGILDRFAKGDTTAVEELKKIYGGAHSDSLSMMAAAAKQGIKLVAVDGQTEKPEGIESRRNDQSDDVDKKELQNRDNEMASRIAKIKEAEPNSKILFVVGASHLDANLGGGDTRQSAGNQLKEIGKEKGFHVTTFSSHIADTSLTYFTTPPIAESASRAVSVETGKTDDLKNFPTTASRDSKDVLGKHDHALFFPRDSALKMLEAEFGPSSSRLLPALDSLKNHMFSQGEKSKGVDLLNRSLKIEEATFGKDSKQVADRHKELADYSEPKLALEHEQKRLAILENLQGDKPTPDFINSLSKTMELQIETGDSPGALKSFDKVVKNLGSDSLDQGTKDRFRGETFAASRRFEELGQADNAIHVLSGMVKFDSKTPDRIAMNSERLGTIGKLNEKLNKPLEAEKAHKESLELAREFIKNGGVNDSVLVNARDNLAMFLEQQGRAAEATPLHQENLEHAKNREPEHHSLNLQLRANDRLLDNSMRLNQPEKASEHFKATVELLDKGSGTPGGKEQSQLYERYAKFLETAGKNEDAKVVRDQIEKVKKLEEKPVRKAVHIESKTRPQ